jgi:YlmC/YmxH family sporulation protein
MKISELKNMRIVNLANGKVLGKISDLILDVNRGYVKAIIMPGDLRWPVFWNNEKELEVPWSNIKKIGHDVIIVDLPEAWSLQDKN